MKKLILVLMLDLAIMLAFVALGTAQTVPVASLPVTAKPPTTDVIIPILTAVAVVSESLPLINRKINGILHLIVALFKLFRNNK